MSEIKQTAWEKVLLARKPERPKALDYIQEIFDDFIEFHGDRSFSDDKAIIGGIATLNKPYDNDYLNNHFNLNMITPVQGKESIYKSYVKKMILSSSSAACSYRPS